MLFAKASVILLATANHAAAQVAAWGQCGGNGFSGSNTCISGYTCNYVNDWFWQCQLGSQSISQNTPIQASPTSLTTFVTSVSQGIAASNPTNLAAAAPAGKTVQLLGRVNPETLELSWPGTGVRFSYNGDAQIELTASGSVSGDLIIDGSTTILPSITGSISLPSGNHAIEFRKRSEAGMGSLFLQTSGTQASNKLIEFIGDSITVGYGLDGNNPCTNNAQLENNPKTYAALTADALGADYNIVAWSGKGLTRNAEDDGAPLMPELWTRYGANDDDNSYMFPVRAQVVVINLGTNDFTYAGKREPLDVGSYQSVMVGFVQTIQNKYPDVKVFLMSSPMLSDELPSASDVQHTTMANALQSAADATGAYFVDWPTQGSDVGCDYHPVADTHAAEASVLAQAIGQVMGW